jgi:hypothetical protein
LADESAESGLLSPELPIGIRRVKGVKRLGRKSGNWLTRNQAQELVNAASKTNLRGWRDGAMIGIAAGMGCCMQAHFDIASLRVKHYRDKNTLNPFVGSDLSVMVTQTGGRAPWKAPINRQRNVVTFSLHQNTQR